jgi:radical SAM/Cys-rich protein
MTRETMDAVEAFAKRGRFSVVDLTGGAPELVPGIEGFLERLAPLAPRLLFRANLTALAERPDLIALLARLRVVVVASFPSLSASQTDSQRGEGVFKTSIGTLRMLNAAGYGREDGGLQLDLVSNPGGAFLPPGQAPLEAQFHRELARSWGITFNHLYTLANMPLGRFRAWLTASGNLEAYLRQLAESFNPCTVGGLMCRNLVSVSWDGVLYDCDFNLARGLPLGGIRTHVSSVEGAPPPGTAIATGDHCYACTAGSGFT